MTSMPITFDSGRSPLSGTNHFFLGQECTHASHKGQSESSKQLLLSPCSPCFERMSRWITSSKGQTLVHFSALSRAPLLSLQCTTGSSAWSPVGWGGPSKPSWQRSYRPRLSMPLQTSLDSRSVSTTQCLWSQPSHIQAKKVRATTLAISEQWTFFFVMKIEQDHTGKVPLWWPTRWAGPQIAMGIPSINFYGWWHCFPHYNTLYPHIPPIDSLVIGVNYTDNFSVPHLELPSVASGRRSLSHCGSSRRRIPIHRRWPGGRRSKTAKQNMVDVIDVMGIFMKILWGDPKGEI